MMSWTFQAHFHTKPHKLNSPLFPCRQVSCSWDRRSRAPDPVDHDKPFHYFCFSIEKFIEAEEFKAICFLLACLCALQIFGSLHSWFCSLPEKEAWIVCLFFTSNKKENHIYTELSPLPEPKPKKKKHQEENTMSHWACSWPVQKYWYL